MFIPNRGPVTMWTRQPPQMASIREDFFDGPIELAWTADMPTHPIEAGGVKRTVTGNLRSADRGVRGMRFAGAQYVDLGRKIDVDTYSTTTFFTHGVVNALTATQRLISTQQNTSGYAGMYLWIDTAGAIWVTFGSTSVVGFGSNARRSIESASGVIKVGVPFAIAAQMHTYNTGAIYLNGVKLSYTASGTGSTSLRSGDGNGLIGAGYFPSISYSNDVVLSHFVQVNKRCDEQILRAYSRNPWQIFS